MPVINVDIDDDVFLPCYLPLVHSEEFFDIDFLYGGRDSGKSRHIAMQLVISCLLPGYFKCLLIRKVLNTVRSSQYDLIKSVIEEWGLTSLFRFNETRLEIICRANKNGFYGRGLDDVGRIKSFNNPSHCWIEEGNQITAEDFVVILTSLRANQQVKTWFSFNPECEGNYADFWLIRSISATQIVCPSPGSKLLMSRTMGPLTSTSGQPTQRTRTTRIASHNVRPFMSLTSLVRITPTGTKRTPWDAGASGAPAESSGSALKRRNTPGHGMWMHCRCMLP